MVANLILLCSLRIYLSFEPWKPLLESRGYLIHLFLGGHQVPIVLDISNTFPFFLNSTFFSSFFL
jgi:hypothetical protein